MSPSFILTSSTFRRANSLHLPKDYIKYNLMECCKQALRAVLLPNPISLCCSQRREICNAPSGFGFVLSLRELASCHIPCQPSAVGGPTREMMGYSRCRTTARLRMIKDTVRLLQLPSAGQAAGGEYGLPRRYHVGPPVAFLPNSWRRGPCGRTSEVSSQDVNIECTESSLIAQSGILNWVKGFWAIWCYTTCRGCNHALSATRRFAG